jgi:hypothetical protein
VSLDVLQAVFEAAQELVGGAQFALAVRRQQATFGEQGENLQGRPDLQRRLAAAANQLEDLRDELDFADAAGPSLM